MNDAQDLAGLWNRRGELDTAGLTRLYGLLAARLRAAHCPELSSLTGAADDYIHDFYIHKVLENPLGRIDHGNVVVTYFRRYLRDRLARREEAARADGEEIQTLLEEQPASTEGAGPELAALEDATGLTEAGLVDQARRFLDSLADWERDYLTLSVCPDRGLPLSTLARSRGIAAYHYKARQLGVTRCKGQYRNTRIGRWLVSLGLEPAPEQAGLVATALKILCWQALTEQDSRHREPPP